MDIIVKGRRTGVSEKFRQHVDNKLDRLSKWEKKGMTVDVEVSKERNPKLADVCERVELTIRTNGPVIRSEAAASDRYGALDLALDKIEARLRKSADRRKVHRGNHAPVSVASATAGLPGDLPSSATATATQAPPPSGAAARRTSTAPRWTEGSPTSSSNSTPRERFPSSSGRSSTGPSP